jgi:hypothetical protein
MVRLSGVLWFLRQNVTGAADLEAARAEGRFAVGIGEMDKKSLFCRYGHTPAETDLKHRFHGEDHGESWREGQDRKQTTADRKQTPILKR